jgi:hypothetical protein
MCVPQWHWIQLHFSVKWTLFRWSLPPSIAFFSCTCWNDTWQNPREILPRQHSLKYTKTQNFRYETFPFFQYDILDLLWPIAEIFYFLYLWILQCLVGSVSMTWFLTWCSYSSAVFSCFDVWVLEAWCWLKFKKIRFFGMQNPDNQRLCSLKYYNEKPFLNHEKRGFPLWSRCPILTTLTNADWSPRRDAILESKILKIGDYVFWSTPNEKPSLPLVDALSHSNIIHDRYQFLFRENMKIGKETLYWQRNFLKF